MKRLLITLLFTTVFLGMQAQKLMTNTEAYQQMLKQYELRKTEFQSAIPEFFTHCDTVGDPQLKEALQFLIAYSPLSDLGNLDIEYFRRQAELALITKKKTPWGEEIPSDVFMHFVLPFRVNNENPDEARMVFQAEIMPRIEGMDLYHAALEVNHWCHEKVAYKSTDIRTSSPLSTLKAAFGRCGEESTFTVAALRSVGIPSRQVYTPRWAHTDDNHAWVEVWVDGEWYFLGACEPSPELNMGWFAVPATRAIMMHTNTFGKYFGDEKTLNESDLYSQLNLLSNYAPTKKATVIVVDEEGNPQQGVLVDFMVYNYAEFYPFGRLKSDEQGQVTIETGYGDLLVWITDGSTFAWAELDAKTESLKIVLPSQQGTLQSCDKNEESCVYDMIITPPKAGKIVIPETSKEEENSRRIAEENKIRGEYEASFPDSAELAEKYADDPLKNSIISYVLKSRGNYNDIMTFYDKAVIDGEGDIAIHILTQLSEKDLRDVPAQVLIDHLTKLNDYKAVFCGISDYYNNYVLSPRIGYEMISPWRSQLPEFFTEKQIKQFRKKPVKLAEWFQENIELDKKNNYYRTPLFPESVLKFQKADYYSRNIAFVATSRSIGVPANLDQATNKAQYFDGQWKNAFPEKEMPASPEQGTLILKSNAKNLKYYTHYTLAVLKEGRFISLDYENDDRLNHFPCTLNLDPGTYRLMTGNRQKDGTVLTRWSFFDLKADETITEYVVLNEQRNPGKSYFKIYGQYETLKKDEDIYSPLGLATEYGLVLVLLDPRTEPAKHFLSELEQFNAEFAELNVPMALVLPKALENDMIITSDWKLPIDTKWLFDSNGDLEKELNAIMAEDGFDLPLVLYLDKKGMVHYLSKGYAVNTVQLLIKTIREIR